ncbi:flavodoxin family protein [Methanobacterium sp. ACI-7]|uniref:flavodoxin family protein n=1 Tax=unclassified Methanobacterium TaxID=2627676 RepID=UPI0039C3FD32
MKIGIVVHSYTGNAYEVARKIEEKLKDAGKDVEIQRVKMVGGDEPKGKDIKLENPPEVDKYDALIFGSPVHAFSLSLAMKTYLEQIPSLQGKKVALFVTKKLRFEWTGGTRAIGQMKKISQSKGGNVVGTGVIVWNKDKDKKIAEIAENFNRLF